MFLLLHHQYKQWKRNAILEYIYKMYETICFIATENVLLFSMLSLQYCFIKCIKFISNIKSIIFSDERGRIVFVL